MISTPLHAGWTVRLVGDLAYVPAELRNALTAGVPATVPGCVHTDLSAPGLLVDPSVGDDELRQFWVGRTDWRYACTFDLDEPLLARQRLVLAADGLDTLATLMLNGTPIGTAANMHRAYRFDLRPAARVGRNELVIKFTAPLPFAEAEWECTGKLPHTGHGSNTPHPHNMLRKMACNMGWDWGPDVTTSRIWRPISIEAWDIARIAHVRPIVTEATAERATVRVYVDLEYTLGVPFRVECQMLSPSGRSLEPD